MAIKKDEALEFHRQHVGKIALARKVKCADPHELALVYTPGVAFPCMEISEDTARVYDYTSKGNLIAVVTDGSAVLGLGDIGPHAGMPVMEGKAILFKQFGDVDALPICLAASESGQIVDIVAAMEPCIGGVNLEDISAPRCFEIERGLKERLSIPIFHDDQHGTAIVVAAGMVNALRMVGKRFDDVHIVMNGAGAAGIAVAKMLLSLGARRDRLTLCDSRGPITTARGDLNPFKRPFARDVRAASLAQLLEDADVFIGVSVADSVTCEMLRAMNDRPIVFAMANPNPEILPELAQQTRTDVLIATGRSDYPNQVNNLLAFPGVFRGALDVRASDINEEMKKAAAHAIASIIPQAELCSERFIPSALNPRVAPAVAAAVAQAAMDSGVAQRKVDTDRYSAEVARRLDRTNPRV